MDQQSDVVVTARKGVNLLELPVDGPVLASEQDAVDLVGLTYGTDCSYVVVPTERLDPRFFDLSSRLAGAFFQKMQNYGLRLVILGDISKWVNESKSLRDFVGETNRIGNHLFVPDRQALLARL